MSSLQAFWPALDVIAGDVEAAVESYMPLWQLWTRFEALPEVRRRRIVSGICRR